MNVQSSHFEPADGLYVRIDPHTDAKNPCVTTRQHVYQGPVVGPVVVPEDFRTDLASIPRFAIWIFGYLGIHQRGCLFHDAAYRLQFCTRFQADALMREIHEMDQVTLLKRLLLFYAVRLFGGPAWRENAKHLNANRIAMGAYQVGRTIKTQTA